MDIKELTREATLAMRSNEFARAIRLLKNALGVSRRNLAADADGPIVETRAHGNRILMDCSVVLSPTQLGIVEEVTANNDFLLFDRVFVPSERDSPAYQSIACLYNIALCYHLCALCVPTADRVAVLRRASYFYKVGIASTGELVDDDDPDPFLVVLYLAFLNNHGHVLSYFCEHDEAHRQFQTIHRTLLFFYRRRGISDPVGGPLGHTVFSRPVGGRQSSALAFFCPLRYMSQPRAPAPAA